MKITSKIIINLTIFISLSIGIGVISEVLAQEFNYVGVIKCKPCHQKQYTIWKGTKHANTFEALNPEEKKEPKCLNCHVAGYRQTQQVKSEVVGVQCESCHGPGSQYIKIHPKKDKEGARKSGMIARPTIENCKTCHNEESPNFKSFDYENMWAAIRH